MVRKLVLSSIAAMAISSVAFNARATAPTSATFNATASVKANCTFKAASFSDLAFGDYDPLSTNKAGAADIIKQTTLSLFCTNGTKTGTIELDAGKDSAPGTRRMTNGTDHLAYELRQADDTTVWAPGAAGALAVPKSTGSTNQIDITVIGHLAAGQDVSIGDYTDTVTATVNY